MYDVGGHRADFIYNAFIIMQGCQTAISGKAHGIHGQRIEIDSLHRTAQPCCLHLRGIGYFICFSYSSPKDGPFFSLKTVILTACAAAESNHYLLITSSRRSVIAPNSGILRPTSAAASTSVRGILVLWYRLSLGMWI